eukprot:scaffold163944_cov27-Tisochrysis_lutea.AAC.1
MPSLTAERRVPVGQTSQLFNVPPLTYFTQGASAAWRVHAPPIPRNTPIPIFTPKPHSPKGCGVL